MQRNEGKSRLLSGAALRELGIGMDYELTTDETAQLARMVNEYGYAKSSEWIIEEMIRAHGCEKAWQMLESERDDLANPELF